MHRTVGLSVALLLATVTCTQAQFTVEDAGTFLVEHTAKAGGNFHDAEILIPLPMTSPMQTVTDLTVEPEATRILLDETKQQGVAVLKLPSRAIEGSVTLRYKVHCHPPQFDTDALAARDYPPYDQDSDLYKKYTSPTREINSEDPAIAQAAAAFAQAQSHPLKRARAIYDAVIDRCTYVTNRPMSATRMMAEGRGNCTAYANLFIALCRAAGIPAQRCGGAVIGEEPPWHCWAEFYLPEVGWVPCDPTNGDLGDTQRERFFGGANGKPEVVFTKGYGFTIADGDATRRIGHVYSGSTKWKGQMSCEFAYTAKRISPVKYCLLFQAGSTKRTLTTAMSEAELKAAYEKAREDGQRCVSVSVASRSAGVTYAAVWETDSSDGEWVLYPNLTRSALQQLLPLGRQNGMMPISIASCALDTGGEVYAAVFAEDEGKQWDCVIGVPSDQFMAKVKEQARSRRAPAVLAGHVRGKDAVFSGLFAEIGRSAAISLKSWVQGNDLDVTLAECRADGFIPVAVAVTDASPPYYHVSALGLGGRIGWRVARDLVGQQVEAAVKEAAKQGLQPVSVAAY